MQLGRCVLIFCTKCLAMHISITRNGYQYQYTLTEDNLGVDFSDDVKWNIYISQLAAKSNRVLSR